MPKKTVATKHMERCSTSYISRETQIKITVRYHYTPMSGQNAEHWYRMIIRYGATGALIHWLWECKMVHLLGCSQDNSAVSYKTKHTLAMWSSSHTPNELKRSSKTCIQMFVAALCIIAKIWKQSRCLSVGEWINCCISRQCSVI